MNTPLRILLGLVLLSATACVRSLDPFCPVAAQAPRPDLNGTWHDTDGEGGIKRGTRWTFADGQVSTTNSAEGVGGTLEVIYFQAGGAWFADSVAAEVEGGLDDWWKMHTVPAHHIAQIVVDGDRLRVTPLSQQWLAAAIRSTNALDREPAHHAGEAGACSRRGRRPGRIFWAGSRPIRTRSRPTGRWC
jgi:hypothetical protein